MQLNKILKGSLICLVTLGMIGGSLNGAANAKRRYHYRYTRRSKIRRRRNSRRIVRKIMQTKRGKQSVRRNKHNFHRTRQNSRKKNNRRRRQAIKKLRRRSHKFDNRKVTTRKTHRRTNNRKMRKIVKKAVHQPNSSNNSTTYSSTRGGSWDDTAIGRVYWQTVRDLNKDRASVNEGPITPYHFDYDFLGKIAKIRARQLSYDGFTHYDPEGNFYVNDLGLNGNWAENIAYTYNSGYQSPESAANEMNKNLFYKERPTASNPDGGGHYQNIVNAVGPVGIGVYTDSERKYEENAIAPSNYWYLTPSQQQAWSDKVTNIMDNINNPHTYYLVEDFDNN